MSLTTFTPNADQASALCDIENFLRSDAQTYSLGGLAGTGKSSIIPEIIRLSCLASTVVTPTGKAASVVNAKLREAGLSPSAKTIHSVCYRPLGSVKNTVKLDHFGRDTFDPIFEYHATQTSLYIVDEASMVNRKTYDRLLLDGGKILFIGDHGQLPPVGEHISRSMESLDYCLETVVRQAEDSPIRQLAYHVRSGGSMISPHDSIDVHNVRSSSEMAQVAFDNGCDMVIAATNKVREAVNVELRSLHGFSGEPILSAGERILITANQHASQIFNGETYTVSARHSAKFVKSGEKHEDKLPVLLVDLVDEASGREILGVSLGLNWRTAVAIDNGLGACDLGYCLTAHKAQGSEAAKVAVVNQNINWMSRDGNTDGPNQWRYTAVTRAKEQLTILNPASY